MEKNCLHSVSCLKEFACSTKFRYAIFNSYIVTKVCSDNKGLSNWQFVHSCCNTQFPHAFSIFKSITPFNTHPLHSTCAWNYYWFVLLQVMEVYKTGKYFCDINNVISYSGNVHLFFFCTYPDSDSIFRSTSGIIQCQR